MILRAMPEGAERDKMQRRFDGVVARIAAVPARVMAQYDDKDDRK